MKYATFGQRFLASLTDFFVLLPLTFLHAWSASLGKVGAGVVEILLQLAFVLYSVWLDARSGQTIGKFATGIRVVRMTGERIGWREAWKRSSVDLVFSVLMIAASFYAISSIPDAQFQETFEEGAFAMAQHEPEWSRWVTGTAMIWYWSELFVMLTNKRRRALHDFLAGTVVVNEKKW